jgi:cytidine deaminase
MLTRKVVMKLSAVANKTRNNAFNFKSHTAYGAAILTTDDNMYGGCNIDGIISNQGVCAETNAMNHAVIHGKYQFKALLVINDKDLVYPCGSCLQYLNQFAQTSNEDIEVIAAKTNGEYQSKMLSELLPNRYFSSSNGEILKTYKNK